MLFLMPLIMAILFAGYGYLSSCNTSLSSALLNISFSVIAAYIFYFVSVYLPNKIKCIQAKNLLSNDLCEIHNSLNNILAVFNGFLSISEENIFQDPTHLLNSGTIHFKVGKTLYGENLTKFISFYITKFNKHLNRVISSNEFHDLDNQTIYSLLFLHRSTFFKYINLAIINPKDKFATRYGNVYNNYLEIKKTFSALFNDKNSPQIHMMTKEELEHYKQLRIPIPLEIKNEIRKGNACFLPTM